jgi:hypothetical protein
MSSQKKVEANRRNARKGTGRKTDAGKTRSSRNSFRHGLNAAPNDNDKDGNEKIAKLRDMLCGQNADEVEYQQATIIAECHVLLARVRAARIIAIETMRISGVTSLIPDYEFHQMTDEVREQVGRWDFKGVALNIKRMAGRMARLQNEYMREQFRCWRSFGRSLSEEGVVTHKDGERLPRTECESVILALKELRALDRYEQRALSRRRRAIERLAAIQNIAKWRKQTIASATSAQGKSEYIQDAI